MFLVGFWVSVCVHVCVFNCHFLFLIHLFISLCVCVCGQTTHETEDLPSIHLMSIENEVIVLHRLNC